jgi:hypothetical protein
MPPATRCLAQMGPPTLQAETGPNTRVRSRATRAQTAMHPTAGMRPHRLSHRVLSPHGKMMTMPASLKTYP